MSHDPKAGALPPNLQQTSSGGGVGKVLIIILVVLLLVIGGCVASCFMSASWFGGVVNAPLEGFVEYANGDSRITDKLGSPIEQVALTEGGTFNSSVNGNQAEIAMTIEGPQGRAEVEAEMMNTGGKWQVSQGHVTFADGSTINVPE